jgi:regulatory protein
LTDLAHRAKQYSFKLLGYRGRSENELREKLSGKGFPKEVISSTISYLKRAGYLDDEALAVSLKRQAHKQRLLGYYGARKFLMKRGIPKGVIDATLDNDESNEMNNARTLLEKKVAHLDNNITESDRRRLWNFLARKGYSLGVIRSVFRDCNLQ